jgi:hypothetical protein
MRPDNEPRSFADAIEDLRLTKRLTRLEWNDADVFVVFQEDRLCIHGTEDDKLLHPLIVSSDILFATDWVVLENQKAPQVTKILSPSSGPTPVN